MRKAFRSRGKRARPQAAICALLLSVATVDFAAPASAQPSESSVSLQPPIDELSAWVGKLGGRLSASVVDLASGALLARHDEQAALNPASNMKILTAAAALALLGPEYVYTTGLYGTVDNSTVSPLVLRGHGDPSFSASDLNRLARALAASGVQRVTDIRVDQSRFDDAFVPPAFEQQPSEWAAFRAPVSAVPLEQNTVTLNVAPTEPGKPARVWFEPPGFVEIKGSVATVAAGGGQHVRLTLRGAAPRLTADVDGSIAAGLPKVRFRRRVDDPRLYPGFVLAEALKQNGVQVKGSVELGGAEVKRLLSYVESAPLAVLIRNLGKQSDNFYAETILKTLGAETRGAPAKTADGAAAVSDFLKAIGADDAGTRVVNGSGLFDANRLSARTLTAILENAYRNPRIGPELLSHLSIGGVDGTLKSRFRGDRARFLVRAKTGTLNRAISLSGYVLDRKGGPPVAFAFLVEGIAGKHGEIRQRIDACVERIVLSRPQ